MSQPNLINSNESFWENRDVRINFLTGLIESIVSWSSEDEVNYVKKIGTGELNPGSDLRHSRRWWLTQYLKSTDLPELVTKRHISAGRIMAKKLLSGMVE